MLTLLPVEYVKRAGNGWGIAGDGVFVRQVDEEGADSTEESSDLDGTILLVPQAILDSRYALTHTVTALLSDGHGMVRPGFQSLHSPSTNSLCD